MTEDFEEMIKEVEESKKNNLRLKGRRNRKVNSDQCSRANTRHLTRILIVLKDSKKKMNYNELSNSTGISSFLSDALNFLVNHKLIKKGYKSGSKKIYYIK